MLLSVLESFEAPVLVKYVIFSHFEGELLCVLLPPEWYKWSFASIRCVSRLWGFLAKAKQAERSKKLSQMQKDIKTIFRILIWAAVSNLYNADRLRKAGEDGTLDRTSVDFSKIWSTIFYTLLTLCRFDNTTTFTKNAALCYISHCTCCM